MSTLRSHHWTDSVIDGRERRRTIGNWRNYRTPGGLWLAAALTGLYAVVLHTQTSGAVTVPSVVLDIYDSLNTTLLGRVTTDSNGDATVNIDAGTYQIRPFKTGHSYSTPQQIVVAGAGTKNITLEPLSVPVASSPGTCVVHGYLFESDGTPSAGTTITFTAVVPDTASGSYVSGNMLTATVDGSGYFSVDLLRGISVRVLCVKAGIKVTKVVPDTPAQDWATW